MPKQSDGGIPRFRSGQGPQSPLVAGGNGPGIAATSPGSRSSKSDYRAAELDSGCFLSSMARVRISPGTPLASQSNCFFG
jgi:hypothetical protein